MSEIERIRQSVDRLAAMLAIWARRDDTKAEPGTREAASHAVTLIDAATGDLYRLRQRLIGEVRIADDAAARRADALLARYRQDVRSVPVDEDKP